MKFPYRPSNTGGLKYLLFQSYLAIEQSVISAVHSVLSVRDLEHWKEVGGFKYCLVLTLEPLPAKAIHATKSHEALKLKDLAT